ncbi:YgaP family membrane protein [Halalkalicoccus jeotgali]|uniref:Inner membrane protein YgaP-like transmembrane domain-containing protein n=1 Tax=Halalkalicoccus jeotgali (strain DSM 18796 / CECT 7217 / JCM 14584 / KCTC 4019 / B3) TaxID=795797 RepID=D8J496_HALJB|nr:DUF2892 domain-containing protein [Halalkalicoccus jeotgali]ADJ13458.1 hypothetical protein HacjB3_00325 [Halalkalicoccus jeotgali B3]ELY33067.1 hypothetical protein C497_19007 [Halalkalicoccus jeotgali B3]
MEKNVCGIDRRVRILGGIGLLAAALRTRGIRRVGALLAGAVLLGTAATQRCPLNALVGIDSCRVGERSEPER